MPQPDTGSARGDLPANVDARLVVDALFAPLMTRVVRRGQTVDDETIVRLVDLVVTGVEHGGGTTATPLEGEDRRAG